MSVKITKPGTLPETITHALRCHNCGCEFTFQPPDATLIYDQRDGDYYRIPCPTCQQTCTKAARP